KDIARERQNSLRLPGKQHLAIFSNLVLTLLGCGEIVGVDVFQSDEDPRDARSLGFLHKVRDLVAKRVDLDHQGERNAVEFAQLDQPVEDRLPFAVAREIVVRDEELVDALSPVEAYELLHVIGRTIARLAALHVDDRTERALVRAAAAGIETRIMADG